MLKKFKSPVVWITLIAQISLVISIFNESISDEFKIIATAIIEVLTVFGILNNPNDKEMF